MEWDTSVYHHKNNKLYGITYLELPYHTASLVSLFAGGIYEVARYINTTTNIVEAAAH